MADTGSGDTSTMTDEIVALGQTLARYAVGMTKVEPLGFSIT